MFWWPKQLKSSAAGRENKRQIKSMTEMQKKKKICAESYFDGLSKLFFAYIISGLNSSNNLIKNVCAYNFSCLHMYYILTTKRTLPFLWGFIPNCRNKVLKVGEKSKKM